MTREDRRHTRTYWRSVERLLDSPAVGGDEAGEFPLGAVEPPDAVSRRTMLGLLGASFALAGFTACRRPESYILPFVSAPENTVPGVPRFYATTMPLGTSAYGLLVESHEGRPIKIEGNDLHPSSKGAASARMQAAILDFYDPDRSSRVLRRPARGAPLRASGWDEFIEFWKATAATLEAASGRGLAVISEGSCSPTVSRLSSLLRERFPEARWVVHEPAGDESLFEGLRIATGDAYRPLAHLDRARRVLALDADILLTESESVANARGLAAGRRVTGSTGEMSRLYVVESTVSLTGANADHRVRLESHRIGAFAVALTQELSRLGLPLRIQDGVGDLRALPDSLRPHLAVIARDLADFPGEALVVAGRRQPAQVHALVFLMNEALGAVGRTLTLHGTRDVAWGSPRDLRELGEAMRGGSISTLIVLGGNPAYTAPVDVAFTSAAQSVAHIVHLGTHADETSELAEWHLPEAHFLESWGDARAADGSVSVIQPLVQPLYGGKSRIELLGALQRDELADGFGLVRDTWLEQILGDGDAEARWEHTLHDGILADSALPPSAVHSLPEIGAAVAETIIRTAGTGGPGTLELVFTVAPSVHDGRFANNGWLQELPDPLTKICWDNAVLVSPNTAHALGVSNGDLIWLESHSHRLEAPVWIAPGQADGSIALALGYGRTRAGRVGTGVGVNAYALRHSDAPHFDVGVRATRASSSAVIARTQEHWAMEGRDLVREASLAEYRRDPHFAAEPSHSRTLPLWQEHEYRDGPQWGMTIDLNACTGCNACITACQSENNVPVVGKTQVGRSREMQWLRVDRYFAGPLDAPDVVFQPVPCMHCENAPCEEVCPVGATVHNREGLNVMVYNRCIGTRYCSNNCPYKVRRFNFFNYTKDLPETVRMAMNPDVTVRSRGVMEKCTYCVQRIHEAEIHAKQEGRAVRDGEIKTACQQTCPSDAIVFGDLRDARSRVAAMKGQDRHYVLLAELGNKPRTSYLAKLRNPNPRWPR
jgi:molybdopterin-containing oxidoreductase family iron-sulfur binding subunit